MTITQKILLSLAVLVAGVLGVLFGLDYMEAQERQDAYDGLLEKGFSLLESGDPDALDQAIQEGLSAQEIDAQGKGALLLLGRAYYLKKNYNRSTEELSKGLTRIEDVDYYPEFNYHLALATSRLFMDLKQESLRHQAMAYFSEAATQGLHRSDAYFGMGMLAFYEFEANRTPMLKEKALIHFRRCASMEASQEGYEQGAPGSPCPHCRLSFQKKTEDPAIVRLLDFLSGD